ncbi:alpha/beta hydrolase-fold protein [Corynebacterium bovis]|uniref:Enterochelin esterase family protein n=2 Tax=Corynebacterium bovis TaxID=36808 RepID=A0A8I0CMM3_9CORY|nr:alpha/beta hydrolase-fold protein [Corynebacterium bovis]MBB3115874.1 enterochelin esterase family protein [Corynebacterium bovis DSM 20582 = CIP 54.80]WJY78509.1 Enterochelin esterase [Corynebacterium bovis DSM 20582 = CIP 54.80]
MSTDETTAGTPGAVGTVGAVGTPGGGAPVRVTVPAGDTAPGTTVVFEDPWRTAAADTAASDTAAGDTAGPDAPPAGPPAGPSAAPLSVTLAPGTAATYSLLVDGTRTADPANPDAAGPTASLVHHPSVDRSLWPARPADAVADMPGSRLRLDRAVLGRRATLRLDVPDAANATAADGPDADDTDATAAARPLPVVVVLDGDDWIHLHDLTTALDTAVTRGLLPPHARVFVPAAPDRAEFADPAAAEGFVGPLLDTVTAAVAAAGARPGPVVLVGQSLGGLGAVLGALADRGRGRVAGVLAQSPSLWWPGAEEGDDAPLSGPAGGDLVQRAAGMDGADAGATAGAGMARLLLTVGEGEPEMHRHVDAGAEALRRLGADVTVRRVPGGHDRAMWRLGIVPGLAELLASPGRPEQVA